MKDRNKLENELIKRFEQMSLMSAEVLDKYQEKLYNKYGIIDSGKYVNVSSISFASPEELFWLADSYNEVCENSSLGKIILKNYFNERDIASYGTLKLNHEEDDLYPIEFRALQVNDSQWITLISSQTIYQLISKRVVFYNVDTQREGQIVRVNGMEIMKISKNKRSIEEIKERLLSNLYITDELTFNVNTDLSDNSFVFSKGKFVLNSGRFDLIDGFHRIMSLIEIAREYPDFNVTFPVNIMTFNTEKARRYITQKDKQTPIKKSYIRMIDPDNFGKKIVEDLNSTSAFIYKGRVNNRPEAEINEDDFIYLVNLFFDKKQNLISAQKRLIEAFNDVYGLSGIYDTGKVSFHVLAGITAAASTQWKVNYKNVFNEIDKLVIKSNKLTSKNVTLVRNIVLSNRIE